MQHQSLTWPFDRAQLTQIYRRYIAMVRRRARSVLHDAALAHDAAQETFARFIAYAEHTEVRQVAAFLYQSATRVSIERLRAQSRQVAMGNDAEVRDRGVWALEDKLALTQVLALTDLETAQIATMYYLDGMSQGEISQVMEIPRRTISAHLQRFCDRALRLLRDREASAELALTLEQDADAPSEVVQS